jgi:hypothetical protein
MTNKSRLISICIAGCSLVLACLSATKLAENWRQVEVNGPVIEGISKGELSNQLTKHSKPVLRVESGKSVRPVDLDPLQVVRESRQPDAALVDWLVRWQHHQVDGKPLSPDEVYQFKDVLDKSPLSAVTMLDLGHAFHFASRDVELTTQIYQAASVRVQRELNDVRTTSERSLSIIQALNDHLSDYKPLLWYSIEEQGHWQNAEILYRLYDGFVRHVPVDDDELQKASVHPRIGEAECLYIMGRYADAEKILSGVPVDSLTEGERDSYNWIDGMLYMRVRNYQAAIDPLQAVAEDKHSKHSTLAEQLLIQAMCNIGKLDEARALYQDYLTRVSPQSTSARILRESLDAAQKHFVASKP